MKKWCQKKDIICVSQIAMHGYIVDFFFPQYGVVVELDGPFHDAKKDSLRDETLLKNGVSVMRFKNPTDRIELNAIFFRVYAEIRYQIGRRKMARKGHL